MSIHLREGFANETLERVLEDLAVRFVVNCPAEDLSSSERVLFQIEEAHWFYEDFIRPVNILLPAMKMGQFTSKILQRCPMVWRWEETSKQALSKFGKYKSIIPVRGCALLNADRTKLLLVQGTESTSWSFPRGKISKDESDVDCALRELHEETGFDASSYVDEDEYAERRIRGKSYKIFFCSGIPEDTEFKPVARNEIRKIKWFNVSKLEKELKHNTHKTKYFLVKTMLKSIQGYIKRMKNAESDEQLKRKATIQLKRLLGIAVAASALQQGDKSAQNSAKPANNESQSTDPGRALLTMLQKACNVQPAKEKADRSPATGLPVITAAQTGIIPPIALGSPFSPNMPVNQAGIPGPAPFAGSLPLPPFPLPFFNPFVPQASMLPAQFPVPPSVLNNTRAPLSTAQLQQLHGSPAAPPSSAFSKPTVIPVDAGREITTEGANREDSRGQKLLMMLKQTPQAGIQKKIRVLKRPAQAGKAEQLPGPSQSVPPSLQHATNTSMTAPTAGAVQLLNILKRRPEVQSKTFSQTRPGQLQSQPQSQAATDGGSEVARSAVAAKPLLNERPKTDGNEDPSLYLLDLLNNKRVNKQNGDSFACKSANRTSGASSELLGILKKQSTVKKEKSSSNQLLSILKRPSQVYKNTERSLDDKKVADSEEAGGSKSSKSLGYSGKAENQRKMENPANSAGSLLALLKRPSAKKETTDKKNTLLNILMKPKEGEEREDEEEKEEDNEEEEENKDDNDKEEEEENEEENEEEEESGEEEEKEEEDEEEPEDVDDFSEMEDFEDFDDIDDIADSQSLRGKSMKTYIDEDDMY